MTGFDFGSLGLECGRLRIAGRLFDFTGASELARRASVKWDSMELSGRGEDV